MDLDEKLSSYRFDVSTDDVVMMVDNLNKHDHVTYTNGFSSYTLVYESHKVEISANPFKLVYSKSGTTYITVNSDNLMTIENGNPEADETWENSQKLIQTEKALLVWIFTSATRISGSRASPRAHRSST